MLIQMKDFCFFIFTRYYCIFSRQIVTATSVQVLLWQEMWVECLYRTNVVWMSAWNHWGVIACLCCLYGFSECQESVPVWIWRHVSYHAWKLQWAGTCQPHYPTSQLGPQHGRAEESRYPTHCARHKSKRWFLYKLYRLHGFCPAAVFKVPRKKCCYICFKVVWLCKIKHIQPQCMWSFA